MLQSDTPKHISPARLRQLSGTYVAHLPSTLAPLDAFRQTHLRAAIAARTPKSKPHVTQPELAKLMEWKLKRGKFRPALMGMIKALPPAQVAEVSSRAFTAYDECAETKSKEVGTGRDKALAILTELRGVGPATASLVLSVYDPVDVPFFSDELFAWLATDSGGQGSEGEVSAWAGKMAYTVKEYKLLCERLKEVRERLRKEDEAGIDAAVVEHAAWVLVKSLAAPPEGEDQPAKKDSAVGEMAGVVDLQTQTTKKRGAPSTNGKAMPSKRKKKNK